MEGELQIKRFTPFLIVSKDQDVAIVPKAQKREDYDGCKLGPARIDPNDVGQLWFIDKVGKNDDDFEIIHLQSNMVLTEDWGDIVLNKGKQKGKQLFSVTKANIQSFYSYYWIRTEEDGKKGLYLEGTLKYGQFDPNSEKQLFRFEQIKHNNTVVNSSLIINKLSGKALDVPNSTFDKGERIIQYAVNQRFNQRWKFIKHDKGYLIQSLLNGLFLDIEGESRSSGAKVIQWERTGNPNQQWLPEHQGQRKFKIRSIHESTMYLTIKNGDVDDGGKLEVTKESDHPSLLWIIEGALP